MIAQRTVRRVIRSKHEASPTADATRIHRLSMPYTDFRFALCQLPRPPATPDISSFHCCVQALYPDHLSHPSANDFDPHFKEKTLLALLPSASGPWRQPYLCLWGICAFLLPSSIRCASASARGQGPQLNLVTARVLQHLFRFLQYLQ